MEKGKPKEVYTMMLSTSHIFFMFATMFLIIGCGIISAKKIRSAEAFSLNGRKGSTTMVAGAIAGTCMGGGATVGTSQLAASIGLSAWWFTLGMGIGFIIMGIFFARPLRNSRLETISQILILSYGKESGPVASIITSFGLFFTCVASVLPATYILAHLLNISVYLASFILLLLIAVYIFFGGMKGASVSGLLKTVILWAMMLLMCHIAYIKLDTLPNFDQIFAESYWFDIYGQGFLQSLENICSLIVGVFCSQTYVQIFFSASDARTARNGAIIAALISMPVGIPCIMAAMYMHAAHPEVPAIMSMPEFAIRYMHPNLAGITIGALLVALIGSVSGLCFGMSTMVSRDLVVPLARLKTSAQALWANRICFLILITGVIFFSLYNLDSQVLTWNFLSMSLRGSIFLPMVLALLYPKLLPPVWAIPAMIISAFFALTAKSVFNMPIPPLFVSFIASTSIVVLGLSIGRKYNYQIMKGLVNFRHIIFCKKTEHSLHK